MARRDAQEVVREVMTVGAECREIFRTRHFWPMTLAQGIEMMGLDNFLFVVEPTSDAGEAVASLSFQHQFSASSQAIARELFVFAFKFAGELLLSKLLVDRRLDLSSLRFLAEPKRF